MDCPKCQGVATNITPMKQKVGIEVYGCSTCGFIFDSSGKPVVHNTKDLADVFRVATEGQKTLIQSFGLDKMEPAQRAILTSSLMEYGVQMWFDGLKQGILLTTISEMKNDNGKNEHIEGNLI